MKKYRKTPPREFTGEARPTCYACNRPTSYCLCGFAKPFEAHCNFLILQHPNERKKYYSTARIVTKTLLNSKLMRGLEFEISEFNKYCSMDKTYLLFPDEEAKDCECIDLNQENTVIVVDGTWSEAKKIIKYNPILKTLPTLTFKRKLISNYRIRKQPKENYLSTLECIGYLLQLNSVAFGHPDRAKIYDSLFGAFNRMVEMQLEHFQPYRGDN